MATPALPHPVPGYGYLPLSTAGADQRAALVASAPAAAAAPTAYADFNGNPVAVSAASLAALQPAAPALPAHAPRSSEPALTLAAGGVTRDTIPRATAQPAVGMYCQVESIVSLF